ncbi:MAG: hypothetical protein WCK35_13965 [Chloroflexota bacterium]
MAKWRHVRMENFQEKINIFPISAINLDWLFNQFPKIKKHKDSDSARCIIEVKPDQQNLVEEAILHYLEENGWEAYAYSIQFNVTSFKRLEE